MTGLLEIEKLTRWFRIFDLEHVRRRRADGVVRIGQESRVDTALHLDAGLGEARLGQGVVLRHKSEMDHVARSRIDGAWAEDKSSVATNGDLIIALVLRPKVLERGGVGPPCASFPLPWLAARSAP